MDTLTVWDRWYSAFEACAQDEQWDRLAPLLTEDARYSVFGVSFACTLAGREALVSGFHRSFAGFDRKFDKRTHIVAGSRVTEPGFVEATVWGIYERQGLPALAFPARGIWIIEGDRVSTMIDIYDETLRETQAALTWIETHGEALGGLDPSYAPSPASL